MLVTFTLSSRLHPMWNEKRIVLRTDEKGIIVLGELKDIDKIVANYSTIGDIVGTSKTWYISNMSSLDLPVKIIKEKGEDTIIKIPSLTDALTSRNFEFFSILREDNE